MSKKTHGASRVFEEAAPMSDSDLAKAVYNMSKGYGTIFGVPNKYSVNDSEKWIKHKLPNEETYTYNNICVMKGLLVVVGTVLIMGFIAVCMIIADVLALFS